MASVLPSRPGTNGTTRSSSSTGNAPPQRKPSFSSFPSRTPSTQSLRSGVPQHRRRTGGGPGGHTSQSSIQTSSSHRSQARQNSSSNHDAHPMPPSLPKKKKKKLRSQYPADGAERHVEYILVAKFDIDKGPVMEHQFPGSITGDESMLAELMLPDGMHDRREDWTIFFLHKDTSEEEEAKEERRRERRTRREERERLMAEQREGGEEVEELPPESESDDEEDDEDAGGEGPPLIYVLNLVNTKQDNTVRRGAVVKAMAICTRHSFLHIYKPLLLLALEEYFKAPTLDTLEKLYDSVNAMDLSLMPRLTLLERQILMASDNKELFVEKFDTMIRQKMAEDAAAVAANQESPSKKTYQLPRDTHEYETRVHYNSIPIPIKVPTAVSPETVGDFSLVKLITTFSAPHTSSAQPFALHPHMTTNGAFTHPIVVLMNAMLTQKRVVFLGHNKPSGEVAEAVLAACALVSGSILRGFTRHAFPYTDLTKIDDLLNVPGFVAGVTNPTFANHPEWWDLLCDIPTGRMKISSRIEAAPPTEGLAFFQQQHPTFAPSNTGILPPSATSYSSSGSGGGSGGIITSGPGSAADPNGDVAFMDDILRSIASRHGEAALRAKFRDYVVKFTRLAAAFEESVYGASALHVGAPNANDASADDANSADANNSNGADATNGNNNATSGHGFVWPDDTARARELAANAWRIEGWRLTRSYYALIQDLAALWGRRPIRHLDVEHQIDRLRMLKLSHDESGAVYRALERAVVSVAMRPGSSSGNGGSAGGEAGYEEVCQLLACTPESHGGIFFLSLGLWHPDRAVREATWNLLERIRTHAAGRVFWSQLGRFAKTAFLRVGRERDGLVVPVPVPGAAGDGEVVG